MKYCKYGCGREARFSLKSSNGELVICEKSFTSCPVNKKKNSDGCKKAHKEGRIPGWGDQWKNNKLTVWSKGLTKYTDERLDKRGKLLSERIKNGEIIPSFTGKKHTKETKEKISKSACKRNNNNGFIKTKFYKIYCPYKDKEVTVQGNYERLYAEYLNENNIKWNRTRKINLKYKNNENDFVHTYFPDFYLVDDDCYVEIKGYFMEHDKIKMKNIIEQNNDKVIKILMKDDLLKLGLKIKK